MPCIALPAWAGLLLFSRLAQSRDAITVGSASSALPSSQHRSCVGSINYTLYTWADWGSFQDGQFGIPTSSAPFHGSRCSLANGPCAAADQPAYEAGKCFACIASQTPRGTCPKGSIVSQYLIALWLFLHISIRNGISSCSHILKIICLKSL